MRGGVEQRPQKARARDLKVTPKLLLGASAMAGDGWQDQEKGAIGEVGPTNDVLDAIEKKRPRGLKQYLVCVGVELSQPKARAGGEPAKRIGQRMGQTRQIVEGKHMRIVRCDHEVAFLARESPHRGHVGIDQVLEQLRKHRLGGPLLARYREYG